MSWVEHFSKLRSIEGTRRSSYLGSPLGTWNPIDHQCHYCCSYCPEGGHSRVARLLGAPIPISLTVNGVWVCDNTDLFGSGVRDQIIDSVLQVARMEQRLPYVFCTKNPERMRRFLRKFPADCLLTTTVESDIDHHMSRAPPPLERLKALRRLRADVNGANYPIKNFQINIAIQPVMEFTPSFVEELREIQPTQISIDHELIGRKVPEPDFKDVMKLAREASRFSWALVSGFNITTSSRLEKWPRQTTLPPD